MKKLLQMKFMLLLCALIVGSGTMWAEEGDTHDFSQTLQQLLNNNASISPINIAEQSYPVEKVVVSYRYNKTLTNAVTVTVKVGDSSWGSQYVVGTGNNYTTMEFSGDATTGDVEISFTNNTGDGTGHGTLYVDKVQLVEGASSSSLENSDLALTGAPVELSFDLYNNSSAQTVSYTTSSTGAVTVSGGENYVTTSISGNTITVTPVAVTPSAQTITVSQAADETYAAGSATFTVTITDSTPIPTHTATFSVNGTTTTTDFQEGAAIEFPVNPADIEGKSFVGWTETAISGTTDETPTFVTSATMGNADITYYAVFADVTPGTSTSITDHLTTSTFGSPSSYGNWSGKKATDGSDAVYAGNSTTYNNTAIQLRAQSPSGIITTTSGGKAKKVTVTWNSGTTAGRTLDIYGKNTAYTEASNLYGNESGKKIGSIVFDGESTELTISGDYEFIGLRSNSGAMYINQIDIDWETGTPDTYSGYCTTVAADTREEAGLSFAESTATVEWYSANQYTGQALTNPHSVSPITWTSSNEGVATVENGTVTVLALGETTIKASFDGDNNYKKGEASYVLTVQDSRTALELSFDPESVEVNVNETVAIPTLNGNLGNGAVTYASDDETIATVTEDANTSLVVTGLAEGTTTITATVAATNEYKEGTATFTVTVIDPNKKGSVNNPYTVDEARDAIDANTGVTGVYATGIVSEIVTEYSSTYGNISYNISADGLTTSDQLQAFRGKSYNGDAFTSADDIQVGDVVVIYGTLQKYGSTYEFVEGNQLVSLDRPIVPTIIVAEATINVNASSQSITRGITVNNLTISGADNFHIKYYNANDEEVEKPSWIEEATVTMENSAYVLSCTVAANEGDERTAYLKVYAMNGDETIYSNLVTITQAKYVPDYATLPFEFNDGRADIEETDGLTQEGLGSDYNANNNPTTKLKFDSTGDWMILKINEIPGTLTFDIKGNSFSGGTFKVQTSADGTTYTDLDTYTDLGDTQTETFNNLAADVRYIKWIYTYKSSGNVGLGNITLGNTMAVAIAAACTDGTKCYSTFSSSKPFIVPEDLTVSEIGIEDGTMNVVNYATGETVPANTGVMVSATTSGEHKLIISSEEGTSVLGPENRLRPTGDNGLTATEMNSAEPETCKFYRLTMHNGTQIGFWWGADGGQSFDIVANKAYLAVPASVAGARNGFAFGDDATGISNVNVNENVNGSVFDLQGRKVSTPGKGLYIVNGKKVVIK